MLRGDDDGVAADRDFVLVFDGDLGFSVGAQEVDLAGFADFGEALGEKVRVGDGRRHELGRLVGGVSEHETLIAGSLLLVKAFAFGDTLRDVGRLLFDGREHGAGLVVESHPRARVADVLHRLAHDHGHVDDGAGRDLARDHDDARLGERLARDARLRILGEDGVENGVGNLVAKLVGMTLGDGLRRELVTAHLAPTLGERHGPPCVRRDAIACSAAII